MEEVDYLWNLCQVHVSPHIIISNIHPENMEENVSVVCKYIAVLGVVS